MKKFFAWIGKAAVAGVAALLLLCLWCSFYFNVLEKCCYERFCTTCR